MSERFSSNNAAELLGEDMLARIKEIQEEELNRMIEERGGDENVGLDDLGVIDERTRERLIAEGVLEPADD